MSWEPLSLMIISFSTLKFSSLFTFYFGLTFIAIKVLMENSWQRSQLQSLQLIVDLGPPEQERQPTGRLLSIFNHWLCYMDLRRKMTLMVLQFSEDFQLDIAVFAKPDQSSSSWLSLTTRCECRCLKCIEVINGKFQVGKQEYQEQELSWYRPVCFTFTLSFLLPFFPLLNIQ